MRNTMRKMPTILGVILAAAAAASAGRPVDETVAVRPGAEISVENLAGSLRFEGTSGTTMEVTGTLGDAVKRLDIEVDKDGDISIEVEIDKQARGKRDGSADLTIRMPASSPLSAETVSASISVSGLTGDVELESVSGAIEVRGAPAKLDVENVSGTVDVENAPDGADLESVSGPIEIGSATGDLDVENVSGTIVIGGGTLGDASIETVSGSIVCRAAFATSANVDIETTSGTITLLVDENLPASYDLSTFSGSINNEIGPEAQRTSDYTSAMELKFNTGSGGATISIESFSGAIRLEKK